MAKVLTAMSGGVDSSVAALLLKQQGYDVAGAMLRLCPREGWTGGALCAEDDAYAVCQRLGISFDVVDRYEGFTKEVIAPFADSYVRGETPNPCVVCNKNVKFPYMLSHADSIGAEYIATGHYVRVEHENGRWLLKKGKDISKDQSYVLWMLTQDVLSRVIFPVGSLTKDEVRAIAEENGFSSAGKPESQDICFVPDGDYAGFLADRCGVVSPEGDFADNSGKVLGRHKGLVRYTVGQRKGLGVSADRPLYVLRKDIAQNRVILGDNSELYSSVLTAHSLNLIALDRIDSALKVEAKVRYSQKTAKATVDPLGGGRVRVEFEEKQRAVTPGQSVVFYDGDTLVGGAVIE